MSLNSKINEFLIKEGLNIDEYSAIKNKIEDIDSIFTKVGLSKLLERSDYYPLTYVITNDGSHYKKIYGDLSIKKGDTMLLKNNNGNRKDVFLEEWLNNKFQNYVKNHNSNDFWIYQKCINNVVTNKSRKILIRQPILIRRVSNNVYIFYNGNYQVLYGKNGYKAEKDYILMNDVDEIETINIIKYKYGNEIGFKALDENYSLVYKCLKDFSMEIRKEIKKEGCDAYSLFYIDIVIEDKGTYKYPDKKHPWIIGIKKYSSDVSDIIIKDLVNKVFLEDVYYKGIKYNNWLCIIG